MSLYGNFSSHHVFTPKCPGNTGEKLTSHVKLICWTIKMFDTWSQQINFCDGVHVCSNLQLGTEDTEDTEDSSPGRSLTPGAAPGNLSPSALTRRSLYWSSGSIRADWVLLFIYLYTSAKLDGSQIVGQGGILPKIASWQDVHRLTLSSWLEGVRVSRVTGGCIVHIPRAKIGGIFQDTHSGTIDCIPRPLLTKKFLATCSLFLDFLCPQMRGLRACVIILQPAPKQIFDDNQCKIIMIYDKIFFSSILKLNLLTPPTSLRPSIRPALISCYVDKLMLIWSCQNSCNSSRNW